MRELNRSGVLKKLEALDTKYLQKIFVAAQSNREIELSEVSAQLDADPICETRLSGRQSCGYNHDWTLLEARALPQQGLCLPLNVALYCRWRLRVTTIRLTTPRRCAVEHLSSARMMPMGGPQLNDQHRLSSWRQPLPAAADRSSGPSCGPRAARRASATVTMQTAASRSQHSPRSCCRWAQPP